MQVPRFWREQGARYNLIGSTCGSCRSTTFPRRTLCPNCRHHSSGKMEDTTFTGRAKVVTWTVVYQAPDAYALQAPYVLAIVELEEGPRVTAPLVDIDAEAVLAGMPVEARFRKLGQSGRSGVIHYGCKFGPRREGGATN